MTTQSARPLLSFQTVCHSARAASTNDDPFGGKGRWSTLGWRESVSAVPSSDPSSNTTKRSTGITRPARNDAVRVARLLAPSIAALHYVVRPHMPPENDDRKNHAHHMSGYQASAAGALIERGELDEQEHQRSRADG